MSPAAVASVWPPLPGAVPNTTLPPDQAWPTGVTSLDSPPRMLSTQTRSSRVAIWSRELMPTWYLKLPTPCLNIVSPPVCLWVYGLGSGGRRHRYAELRRNLVASASLHPGIG